MADLLTLLTKKQKPLQDAAVLDAILDRPANDFFTYIKQDGSIGSLMRWERCPEAIWATWKAFLPFFLKPANF